MRLFSHLNICSSGYFPNSACSLSESESPSSNPNILNFFLFPFKTLNLSFSFFHSQSRFLHSSYIFVSTTHSAPPSSLLSPTTIFQLMFRSISFQNHDQTCQQRWRVPPDINSPTRMAVSLPRGRCTANSPLPMAVC